MHHIEGETHLRISAPSGMGSEDWAASMLCVALLAGGAWSMSAKPMLLAGCLESHQAVP